MNKKAILIIGLLASLIFMAACGTEPAANDANTANGNTANKPAVNADPLAVETPQKAETTNNAPIITPVLKAYCAAKVAKDEAALRKIYSSETIAEFEKEMKEDGITSLVEHLSIDDVTNEPCEARNEVINGDTATAEAHLKFAPQGIRLVFVKENGEWKMTNRLDTEASKKAEQKAKQ
jgi:hypothetical protein